MFFRLKRKEKLYGLCYMKSYRLSMEQYRCIIDGEYEKLMHETDNLVLQRFLI